MPSRSELYSSLQTTMKIVSIRLSFRLLVEVDRECEFYLEQYFQRRILSYSRLEKKGINKKLFNFPKMLDSLALQYS